MSDSPQHFEIHNKQLTNRLGFIRKVGLAVLLLTGIVVSVVVWSNDEQPGTFTWVNVGLVWLVVGISAWRMSRRTNKAATSMQLEIGADYVQAITDQKAPIRIERADIEWIAEYNTGWLVVHGKKSGQQVSIPPGMARFNEAKAALAQLAEIEQRQVKSNKFKPLWVMAVFVALFVLHMTQSNLVLVTVLGALVVGLLTVFLVYLRKIRSLQSMRKKIVIMVVILLVLAAARWLVAIYGLYSGTNYLQ